MPWCQGTNLTSRPHPLPTCTAHPYNCLPARPPVTAHPYLYCPPVLPILATKSGPCIQHCQHAALNTKLAVNFPRLVEKPLWPALSVPSGAAISKSLCPRVEALSLTRPRGPEGRAQGDSGTAPLHLEPSPLPRAVHAACTEDATAGRAVVARIANPSVSSAHRLTGRGATG